MKKTIVVLIALLVAAIFYWQFFMPQPSPAAKAAPSAAAQR